MLRIKRRYSLRELLSSRAFNLGYMQVSAELLNGGLTLSDK